MKKIMRTWCKAGVVFPVLLLFCATVAWRVSADDLILEPGQSHTVTGTESYGRVFVNGDLTVGAGAKLTVETLCVASNITGTANLVLEENANLVVLKTGAYDCVLGAAGGTANVEMKDGSTFLAGGDIAMLHDPGSPAAFPHVNMAISNATLFATNQIYFLKGRTGSPTERLADIRLDSGAILRTMRLRKASLQEVRFLFNGGAVHTYAWDGNQPFIHTGSNNSSKWVLEATNANPVAIFINSSRSTVFGFGSQGAVTEICGDGDLSIGGTQSNVKIATSNEYWKVSDPNLRFIHTGTIRFCNPKTEIGFYGILRGAPSEARQN